jgi:hypothetical protein
MNSKLLGLFALSFLTLIFIAGMASAATLANWNFEDSNLVIDSGTGTLTLSDTRTATYPAGNAPSAVAAMSSTAWNVADRYIEISLSTRGYQDITLKMDSKASATGPTSFKIQYSSDGKTFTDLTGSTTSTVAAFTANPMKTFDFSAVTSIDNNANTKLRIVVPTTGIGSDAAGTFVIDNLLIEGTVLPTTPSEVTSCTTVGNPGELKIKKIDFTNNGMQYNTFGEDDEWFPFEQIDVTIDVKNDGDYDVSDIEVSWGLWDTKTNQWVIDFDDEDTFDIDKGDDESLTVKFTIDDDLDVDLEDLSDGNNYRLYVVASGTIDDNDAGTLDGRDTCASDFEPASIIVERDFVILNNFQVPETLTCGSNVEIIADAWNIGDKDQDEVSVQVTSTDFKLNENIPVGDLDAFDSQKVSFILKVPSEMTEKTYVLKFEVLDEDEDTYQNDYDDDYSKFSVPVTVKGGCTKTPVEAPVTVTASLASGGKSGQSLVVKATLTNTGKESASYLVASSGHGQWASTYEVVPSTLTLAAGQSGDATFKFNVNKDTVGEQTFYIEIVSGNNVKRQPVSVVIEKSGLFSSITGGAISENAWVWGLGALNVLLILVIIIVAFRVMRK